MLPRKDEYLPPLRLLLYTQLDKALIEVCITSYGFTSEFPIIVSGSNILVLTSLFRIIVWYALMDVETSHEDMNNKSDYSLPSDSTLRESSL